MASGSPALLGHALGKSPTFQDKLLVMRIKLRKTILSFVSFIFVFLLSCESAPYTLNPKPHLNPSNSESQAHTLGTAQVSPRRWSAQQIRDAFRARKRPCVCIYIYIYIHMYTYVCAHPPPSRRQTIAWKLEAWPNSQKLKGTLSLYIFGLKFSIYISSLSLCQQFIQPWLA